MTATEAAHLRRGQRVLCREGALELLGRVQRNSGSRVDIKWDIGGHVTMHAVNDMLHIHRAKERS